MNIILNKNLKNDSNQPIVFELGQVTTTLQDLLDSSTITISGLQTIILSINDINNNNEKYLLPINYYGSGIYGLGKYVLESNLIKISSDNNNPTLQSVLNNDNLAFDTSLIIENSNPEDLSQIDIRSNEIFLTDSNGNVGHIMANEITASSTSEVRSGTLQHNLIVFTKNLNSTTFDIVEPTGTGSYIFEDLENRNETVATKEWVLQQLNP